MPRTGRHPLKTASLKSDPQHKEITLTTITHIPLLEGYWLDSLQVLRLFFTSLVENTPSHFDLMVFDNHSCQEVQDYLICLHREGVIQYLTLSEQNLKKLGALNFILSTAPGEYIAYSDSDIYFLSGWLEKSIEILDTFPEAAKVTALPVVGGDTTLISAYSFKQAASDPTIELQTGQLVKEQYVRAHQISLGLSEEQYKKRLVGRKDTLLTRDGVQAFLSSADFQFVIRREALDGLLPLQVENPQEYHDPIYSPVLELRLDGAGLWQLSTPEYLVHHMGNKIPDLNAEIPWIKWPKSTHSRSKKPNFSKYRIFNNSIARYFLHRLHTLSYKLLYE